MFSWTRNFYAERDGVFYQFEKKSDRDDAVENYGFNLVSASEAYKHYPKVKVEWRQHKNLMKLFEVCEEQNIFLQKTRRTKMDMLTWAKNEIELAKEKEKDDEYGKSCYDSAFNAFKSLCNDGHSGFSISITKNILNRLIDGQCLTYIYDTDDIWDDVILKIDERESYQCKRMSSLFKDVYKDGRIVYTDTGRITCVDIDSGMSYYSGKARKIIDEMYPITMPYLPPNKPYIMRTEEIDPEPGEYIAVHYIEAITPTGETIPIDIYESEGNDGKWVRISKDEYEELKKYDYRDIIKEDEMLFSANVYQKEAVKTDSMKHDGQVIIVTRDEDARLLQGLMGLNGEAGECVDILKKYLFQGHDLDKYHLAMELGDVAWYLAISADALGYDLETIFKMNINKLRKRYPEGKFSKERSANRNENDI